MERHADRFVGPVAIVGVGETRVGRLRGASALRLTLDACHAALRDAKVLPSAVDGVLTRNLDIWTWTLHTCTANTLRSI